MRSFERRIDSLDTSAVGAVVQQASRSGIPGETGCQLRVKKLCAGVPSGRVALN